MIKNIRLEEKTFTGDAEITLKTLPEKERLRTGTNRLRDMRAYFELSAKTKFSARKVRRIRLKVDACLNLIDRGIAGCSVPYLDVDKS